MSQRFKNKNEFKIQKRLKLKKGRYHYKEYKNSAQ